MVEPSTADLMKELRDMDRFLNNMQKDAKKLLGEVEEPTSLEKAKQTEERRRLSSASSWARSTTKKDNPLTKRKTTDGGTSIIDVTKAERYVKTRTPEYTFGVRTPRTEERRKDGGYFNGDYDVKVDSLSTLKRPKTSVISKTARLDPYGYRTPPVVKLHQQMETDAPEPESTVVDEGQTQGDMDLGMDEQSEAPSEPDRPQKAEKVLASKAYSFGRDKRFVEPKPESMYVAVVDQTVEEGVKVLPAPMLDVERAAKAILPHTGTAVMGPRPTTPTATRHAHHASNPDTNDNNEADGASKINAGSSRGNDESVPLNMHLDALSYRPRTPNVTMRPDRPTQRTPPVHIDLGTPGPGYYNTTTTDVDYTTSTIATNKRNKYTKPVGTIYHTSTKPKNETALYTKQASLATQAATLGPGVYNTAQSINSTRHNAPAYTLYTSSAEAKPTPQMLRKQYFEQKARDLREVHDNQSETNLTLVTARTPVTSLAPPKWSKRDPHREELLTEHRIRNINTSSTTGTARSRSTSRLDHILGTDFGSLYAEESLYTSPNKKFSAVEKRVKTGAFMKAEVTARRSTSARIQSRPGVAMRVAQEKEPMAGKQRFYGPQIPVPWTQDRLPSHNTPSAMRGDAAQEVLQMLADRAANQQNSIMEGGNNPNVHLHNKDIYDTAYTEAYLKSAYSGSLQPKKPAILMQPPPKHDERNINNKLTLEQQERDFIGPQLQHHWVDENNKSTTTNKHNTLRMDLVPGREIVKQHAKGVTEIITFNDKILPSDDVGPGKYENNQLNIANAGAKVVPFNKQIARQDMVGAYGERPENAIQDMHILAEEGLVEHDLYYDENIELNYGRAKDKVVDTQKHKNLQLYVKDRHPAPKPSTDDHLGGTYFQGMAETALKKPGMLFDKQTSRFETPHEKEVLEEVLGPLDGELDLQVNDFNPHKGNIIQNVVMQDPKKYPRFVPTKPEVYDPTAPLPNLDFYDFNTKKEPILVNMDRMQGRRDGDKEYENELIAEEKVDNEGALRLAAEQDSARHTAHTQQSHHKRTIQAVHMDKQTKPSDNAPIQAETLLHYANNEQAHRLYDDPDLTKPVTEDPNRKLKNNVRDWSKVPGRNSVNNDATNRDEVYENEAKLLGAEVLPVREELELDPTKEGTSKHKKVQSGVEWTKNSDIPRFPPGAAAGPLRVNEDGSLVQTERVLDLQDVDPGKFKSGMAPLGATTTGANLSNQTGRSEIHDLRNAANNPEHRKILDSIGLGEELILEPSDNPMQKSTQKTMFGSKHNTAGVENTNAGEKVLKELKKTSENSENQELRLEPSDAPLRKRVQGSVSMQNKSANNTHKMDAVVGELAKSVEVLQLSPRAADKHLYNNPVLATSMSNKNIIYESHHATGINEEIRQSATVLDLTPTDQASKFRVTGGTSMGNKQTIRNSSNEALAIQEFNRTSTQELKIDPTIQATRVSIPNSALSRETRIASYNENNLLKQLNQDEVLDLEPAKPRRVKSNTTLHNTEHRFNSHREDNVEKELNNTFNDTLGTTQPELLIIEPTDKTIKKNSSEVKFGGANTGRGGAIAKETVSARNKNTATDTNNGKKRATANTTSSGKANSSISGKMSSINGGSGKVRSATPVGNKRTSTAAATGATGATVVKTSSAKNSAVNDAPTTPQVSVPELSSKPPIFKKLSQKELNSINSINEL